MALPDNLQWFDWVSQEWITIKHPHEMTFELARRLLPQNHYAQHALENHVKAGMTPYRAMLLVQSNGGK